MFGYDPASVVGFLVVGLVCELALLWTTAALMDKEVDWGRLFLGSVCSFVLLLGLAYGAVVLIRTFAPDFPTIPRWDIVLPLTLAVLLVIIAVTGVLYTPILSVSFGRGQWASTLQLLLRGLLYSLIIGVISVVLAVIQLGRGTSPGRAHAPPTVLTVHRA